MLQLHLITYSNLKTPRCPLASGFGVSASGALGEHNRSGYATTASKRLHEAFQIRDAPSGILQTYTLGPRPTSPLRLLKKPEPTAHPNLETANRAYLKTQKTLQNPRGAPGHARACLEALHRPGGSCGARGIS